MGGAEVFFVGSLDSNLLIDEVEAYAFGNQRSVPALLQYARPGNVIVHNHPSGHLEPSAADVELASVAGERSIGSYIVNNDCTQVRIVVRAMSPKGIKPLDTDRLVEALSPGGLLAASLPEYEFRASQIEMMRAVTHAFNKDGIAIIEAATGTGKSIAYLLPAIAWSIKNEEKVLISTHTINLQEQLIEKDLPLLKDALGVEFDAVLLKGRNNYISRRRAEYLLGHPDFLQDRKKREQTESIHAWMKTTRDGSVSDLGFIPDPDVWDGVMSDSDNCLRVQCPTYQSCFFYNARRRAARAQILVVNHHLLMADLAVRAETGSYSQTAVLPPAHRIVVDEAHHIEEVATAYFGSRVSRMGLVILLRRLASPKTGEGLLHYLASRIQDGTYPLQPRAAETWLLRLSRDLLAMQREVLDAVEEAAERTAIALDEMQDTALDQPSDIRLRVTPEIEETDLWNREIVPALTSFLLAARPLLDTLDRLYQALKEAVVEDTPETLSPLLELQSTQRKIESHVMNIARFLEGSDEQCRWIEYRRANRARKPRVVYCVAPLAVAEELRERLFQRVSSVIMTSATLAVDRKFDYFLQRIGAADPAGLALAGRASFQGGAEGSGDSARSFQTLLLETPFDYDSQVYIGVPTDLPNPNHEGFAKALEDFLSKSLRISRGRAFVLFTSYSLLNRVYDEIAGELEADGFPCLRQGAAGRSVLAKSFRGKIGSILFATSSFWEGVDIAGEALSCLVLTRLPFVVPSEPIIEARVEAMKKEGVDPFSNLIVPRAVIRFRQGFGRLIRRSEDRGAVLICDHRVATASYGRTFLGSLPTRKVHIAPAREVYRRLESFFDAEKTARTAHK